MVYGTARKMKRVCICEFLVGMNKWAELVCLPGHFGPLMDWVLLHFIKPKFMGFSTGRGTRKFACIYLLQVQE